MKHIIAAIALLAITAPALAEPQIDPEYRMWAAEQMVNRVVTRLGRMNAACKDATLQTYLPKVSETCEKSIMGLYPQLNTIRQIATSGDEVAWSKVIDVVHKLERDTEAPLQTLGK